MAYQGLEAKFLATYRKLYDKYSLKGSDSSGEPYLEYKPYDPNRNETENDTLLVHPGSAKRDSARLSDFLSTTPGKNFLIRQEELQSGNTFSETRLYDPLSLESYLFTDSTRQHIQRSIGSAAGLQINDPTASPASTPDVGMAGRLQLATKDHVISNLMGRSGYSNLLHLLPLSNLTRIISGMQSILQDGIEGVNDRPEIDFDGQFFSVAQWRGFQPLAKPGDPLAAAGAQLRTGNVFGALSTFINGVANIIKTTTSAVNLQLAGNNRGDPNDTTLAGWRYFIVDSTIDNAIDRYLNDTVEFKSISSGIGGKEIIVPTANVGIFNRKPVRLIGSNINPERISDIGTQSQLSPVISSTGFTASPPGTSAASTIALVQSRTQSVQSSLLRTIGNIARDVNDVLTGQAISLAPIDPLTQAIDRLTQPTPQQMNENPAESKMTYPDLSLQARYVAMQNSLNPTDESLALDTQLWQQTYKNLESSDARTYGTSRRTIGIIGGFRPGDQMPDDIATRNIKFDTGDPTTRGRYFSDPMNLTTPIFVVTDDVSEPPNSMVQTIRNSTGNLIDFMFYDYVNKKILPFRAFLTDINESVSPNYDDQQYIGRIERNIIYLGVVRDATFTFRIQAFSAGEMKNVWTKINYLTGLTFPSMYSDGFLVPPFVKLTIGNVYVDQPGYIKSLSYKFDDDGWEIDENYQAPMGVTVNVTFNIIEKKQMRVDSTFYPFGLSREVTPTAQSSNTPIPDTSTNTLSSLSNNALSNFQLPVG